MEIIRIFHSGYFDYKGTFQTAALLCNGLNMAENKALG